MKRLLFSIVLVIFCSVTFAQLPTKCVQVEELRQLVDESSKKLNVLFIGNDFINDLKEGKHKNSGFGRLRLKSNILIVFSEDAKALIESSYGKKVFLGKSFDSYFTRFWRGQDYLTLTKIEGKECSFVWTIGDSN